MIRAPILMVLVVLMAGSNAGLAAAVDPAALNLKAVEGDGATYAPGSRATRGVSVLVTDQAGSPVGGAIVTFTLPLTGPSGEFSSGGRTEIVTTKGDGRASVWGMRWNRVAGPFEIRVGAAKGQIRTGMTMMQNLAGEAQSKSSAPSGVGAGGHKWLWIALAGAAAAGAAGFAAKGSSGNSGSSSTASASSAGLQIGTPSISLGHP